jgi:hypothetical protein
MRIGNATPAQLLKAGVFAIYRELIQLGVGYRFLIRFYNWIQDRRGGIHYPFRVGKVEGKTPTLETGLEIGDWVKVKSHEEILETLDKNNKNRGLWFDAEMVPYCGQLFRVSHRVNKIINEKTGEMMQMKNPCIGLENVYCRGRYTQERLFCPRRNLSYWRELWLEKVSPESQPAELASTRASSDTAG